MNKITFSWLLVCIDLLSIQGLVSNGHWGQSSEREKVTVLSAEVCDLVKLHTKESLSKERHWAGGTEKGTAHIVCNTIPLDTCGNGTQEMWLMGLQD